MIKCFAAHNSFWINPQGFVRPCGRYKENMQHISNFDNWSDVVQSNEYKKLQSDLDNDVWNSGCWRCKQDEANNIKSKRMFYERVELGPDDFMVDISMGNYCNLKCRMCGPHNSTLWKSDYELLTGESYDDKTYVITDNDILKLQRHLDSVKGDILIELKGGEPFIMPQTEVLISKLLELKNCNRISLLIVTNATVVPQWLYEYAKRFKEIRIAVSVDGIDEVYNYIRGTTKFNFNQCLNNIENISKIPGVTLQFNVVIQNLNIHQLKDIHITLSKFSKSITYITLSQPEYHRINVLPKRIRDDIYQDFNNNNDVFGTYLEQIKNIYKLLQHAPKKETVDKFLKITNILDKSRNQKLKNIIDCESEEWQKI